MTRWLTAVLTTMLQALVLPRPPQRFHSPYSGMTVAQCYKEASIAAIASARSVRRIKRSQSAPRVAPKKQEAKSSSSNSSKKACFIDEYASHRGRPHFRGGQLKEACLPRSSSAPNYKHCDPPVEDPRRHKRADKILNKYNFGDLETPEYLKHVPRGNGAQEGDGLSYSAPRLLHHHPPETYTSTTYAMVHRTHSGVVQREVRGLVNGGLKYHNTYPKPQPKHPSATHNKVQPATKGSNGCFGCLVTKGKMVLSLSHSLSYNNTSTPV